MIRCDGVGEKGIIPETKDGNLFVCPDSGTTYLRLDHYEPAGSAGLRLGPSLVETGPSKLFAPKEPPLSPAAAFLKELTSQLEGFEFSARVSLPVQGLNDRFKTVRTESYLVLEDKGKIELVKTAIEPYMGELTVPLPLDAGKIGGQIPILGPFFKFKVLQVSMDPTTRELKGKIRYFFFTDITGPWELNAHKAIVGAIDVPAEAKKGEGYDFDKAVPVSTWQVADLSVKVAEAYKKKGVGKIVEEAPVGKILPLFEQGKITADGNFGNRTITVAGVRIGFAPLPPGRKNKITIEGDLTNPLVTIEGVQSIESEDSRSVVRLTNEEHSVDPVRFRVKWDPAGGRPTTLTFDRYRSEKVKFVVISKGNHRPDEEPTLRFKLEEGIEMEGLVFEFGEFGLPGPTVRASQVTARQVAIDGYGAHLSTSPSAHITLKDVRITPSEIAGKRPDFFAKIIGEATGEVRYDDGNATEGYLAFRNLEGEGDLRVFSNKEGKREVTLDGNFSATIPELRLAVKSKKMAAAVDTLMTAARVVGSGRLTVLPEERRILLSSTSNKNPLQIEGKGGLVRFSQNSSEAKKWPELGTHLGSKAPLLKSEFRIRPDRIGFEVTKMELAPSENGQGTLVMVRSSTREINIQGDAWGTIVARLPGGYPRIITIPETAKFKEASFRIALLEDKNDNGERDITFTDISIDGKESQPTIPKKEQKSCGSDRQRIKAMLGRFDFSPGEPDIRLKGIGPVDVVVREPVLGGCVVVKKE